MTNNDMHSDLTPLRSEPISFTLEQSLQLADAKTTRRIRRRRYVVVLMALSVAALILQFSISHNTSTSTSSALQKTTRYVPAPLATDSQEPTLPATKQQPKPRLSRGIQHQNSIIDVAPIATPDVIKSLDLDPKAYGEIAAMLGTADRVIMVENTANKESCIQISCSGGESHTITCSLPAPLPFRVTKLDGTLLYDIERSAGNKHTDELIPIRMKLHDSEVLLWYDAEPALTKTIGQDASTHPAMKHHTITVLRPDNSIVFRIQHSSTEQPTISLRSLTGSRVHHSHIVWHRIDTEHIEVSVGNVHRGAYELVTTVRPHRVGRSLLMVK